MYTYIIESQEYYKIGRAECVIARLKSYDTHNPLYRVVRIYEGDYEEWLHVMFRDKHSHLEWFKLTQADIDKLPELSMPDDISIEEVRKESEILVYTSTQLKDIAIKRAKQHEIKKMLKEKINKIIKADKRGHPYRTHVDGPKPKVKREGMTLTRKKIYKESTTFDGKTFNTTGGSE